MTDLTDTEIDELVDTDPIKLRDVALELKFRATRAERELSELGVELRKLLNVDDPDYAPGTITFRTGGGIGKDMLPYPYIVQALRRRQP